AATANCWGDGRWGWPRVSTKSHCSTPAGSGFLVVTRVSSKRVGERMRNSKEPGCGRWRGSSSEMRKSAGADRKQPRSANAATRKGLESMDENFVQFGVQSKYQPWERYRGLKQGALDL